MINFNGRQDGLGNRIEQLINIEAYCILNDVSSNYYWNNDNVPCRSYDIKLKCNNIIIQDKHIYENCDNKLISNISDKNIMRRAADNIKYYEELDILYCNSYSFY